MTDTPTKVIVNCETGEESVVPLTPEEIAEMNAAQEKMAAEQAAREAEAAAVAQAKTAAISKLETLGLTPEEIAALTK